MSNEYSTLDLGLAAALVTLGLKIDRFTKETKETRYGPRPVSRFFFQPESFDIGKLDEVVRDYYDDTLMVPASKYWAAAKNIKTQIYAEER